MTSCPYAPGTLLALAWRVCVPGKPGSSVTLPLPRGLGAKGVVLSWVLLQFFFVLALEVVEVPEVASVSPLPCQLFITYLLIPYVKFPLLTQLVGSYQLL